MPTTILFHALLVLLSIHSLFAGDWSQFRGPTGQGHAEVKKMPLRWSATDKVVWKKELPGTAWSSPVLGGSKLFLTNAVPDGEGISLRALRVDALTGNLDWDLELFRM
ncbi:MAG: serine/threonine protein kinase, partial [Opitutae bacterium]|nr:serine/threonine protein kinase [Opitutae bacterium]